MGYGLAIKAARKQAGLTQAQLAKKCGMAAVTIQQYERDVREPRKKQLETIASALGVSVDVLYGLNPLPTKKSPSISGEQTKKSPSESGEGRAIDVVDDELREYLDELRSRPEKKLLFSVTKNATKEQIEAIVKMVEAMQGDGGTQ